MSFAFVLPFFRENVLIRRVILLHKNLCWYVCRFQIRVVLKCIILILLIQGSRFDASMQNALSLISYQAIWFIMRIVNSVSKTIL